MSVRKLVFAVAGLSVVAVTAYAAPSQVSNPIYEWRTESANDQKTGAFNHCLVKNMYSNGALLMLAENFEGIQKLIIHFPMDKMKPGDKFDLTLQVDRRDTFPVEAAAIEPRILSIAVPAALPDQMRKGSQLFLRGPEDEVVYTLKGMDGAVIALRDCVASSKDKNYQKSETQVAETGPQAMPAAPVKPVAKPPVAAPMIDKKVIETAPAFVAAPALPVPKPPAQMAEQPNKPAAKTILPPYWHDIFAKAGLAPTALDKTSLPQPLDYTWRQNGFTLGLKDHFPFDQGINYLQRMKNACGSSFVAESSPIQEDAARHLRWQLTETACSTAAGDKITALFFASVNGQDSMVLIEGPADKGGAIIKARNAVLKAVH